MMQGVFRHVKNDEQRGLLFQELRERPYPYKVQIQGVKAQKTVRQLAYAHSLIGALAEHAGAHFERAKLDAKLAFGVWTHSPNLVTGDRSVECKSLADYTRDEMGGFISGLEAHLVDIEADFIPSDWRGFE